MKKSDEGRSKSHESKDFDPQRHIIQETQDKQRIEKEIRNQIEPPIPRQIIHERSMETLAPSGQSGEIKQHTGMTSGQNISIYGN